MLLTSPDTIRTLQRKLYAKAKQQPAYRIHALYDSCIGQTYSVIPGGVSWPTEEAPA